jgi:radical SAM protein with 4Fe4S-binding SPASM domain
MKIIMLTLCNRCNLDCTYCYEENKNCESLSLLQAKKILDKELKDCKKARIDLFGGEPFLEFYNIKEITNYALSNFPECDITLSISTNGTLVDENIQEWLKQHKDVLKCSLSIDGTKEMHNINRNNSFDEIDLHFFKSTYPEQGIKMTISPLTLSKLSKGVIFLHNYGFKVYCNLAYGMDWTNSSNLDLLNSELDKLIEFYLNNPDVKPCSMLNMSTELMQNNVTIPKWCGVGTNIIAYDTFGDDYPCQFFMPLSVGNKKAKAMKNFKFNEQIQLTHLPNKCASCDIVSICPTCYGSNYMSSGNIYKKSDDYCLLTKTITKKNASFKYLQLQDKLITMTDQEELSFLEDFLKINNLSLDV